MGYTMQKTIKPKEISYNNELLFYGTLTEQGFSLNVYSMEHNKYKTRNQLTNAITKNGVIFWTRQS